MQALSNGCYVLEPRVLVPLHVVSARSLKMLGKSVASLKKGLASAPVDLSAFTKDSLLAAVPRSGMANRRT